MDGKQVDIDTFMNCVEQGFGEIDKIISSIDGMQERAGKTKSVVRKGFYQPLWYVFRSTKAIMNS
jgi:hypothetical protein